MRTREWKTEVNNLHKSYSNEIKKLDNKLNRKDQTIKKLRNKIAGSKALKKFPNGFTEWVETHHEVVKHIHHLIFMNEDKCTPLPQKIKSVIDNRGTGGVYELAEELTDRFELINKGRQWDGEYFEEVEEFLTNELK